MSNCSSGGIRKCANPAGTRLLEMGRTILQTCNAAKSESKDSQSKASANSVMSPLSSGPVSNLLNSFQQANPNIPIEVVDGHCDGWCKLRSIVRTTRRRGSRRRSFDLDDRLASKFATQLSSKFRICLRSSGSSFAQRQAVSAGDLARTSHFAERCVYMLDVTNALASLGVRRECRVSDRQR